MIYLTAVVAAFTFGYLLIAMIGRNGSRRSAYSQRGLVSCGFCRFPFLPSA